VYGFPLLQKVGIVACVVCFTLLMSFEIYFRKYALLLWLNLYQVDLNVVC
jgi:hypothetical protein